MTAEEAPGVHGEADEGVDPGNAPDADDGEPTPSGHRCDLCGGPMLDRHCKLVCMNCGYQRDCSDP